jgi:hypothetical protein
MYPLYKDNANNMDSNPMSGILEDGRIGTGFSEKTGIYLTGTQRSILEFSRRKMREVSGGPG